MKEAVRDRWVKSVGHVDSHFLYTELKKCHDNFVKIFDLFSNLVTDVKIELSIDTGLKTIPISIEENYEKISEIAKDTINTIEKVLKDSKLRPRETFTIGYMRRLSEAIGDFLEKTLEVYRIYKKRGHVEDLNDIVNMEEIRNMMKREAELWNSMFSQENGRDRKRR